jgi:hypothetical protein
MRMITMFAITALFALSGLVIAQNLGGSGLLDIGTNAGLTDTQTGSGTKTAAGGTAQAPAIESVQAPKPATGSTAKTKTQGAAAADQPPPPDMASLLSMIKSSETNANRIRNLSKVANVEIVEVPEVTGNEVGQADARAVENAVSRNEMDIEDLRAAIDSNKDLTAALDRRSVALDNVIAAKVDEGGKVTLFTRQG